jgi:hypothetical protein
LPTHSTSAELYTRDAGSRPASWQASRTRANCPALSSSERKGTLNSAA